MPLLRKDRGSWVGFYRGDFELLDDTMFDMILSLVFALKNFVENRLLGGATTSVIRTLFQCLWVGIMSCCPKIRNWSEKLTHD